MSRAVPNKQKLTTLTVTKLRPTTKPFLVWDTYQRGLALQIQPSGYRAYKLIYRFHNRPRWFHIGAADAIAGCAQACRRVNAGSHSRQGPGSRQTRRTRYRRVC